MDIIEPYFKQLLTLNSGKDEREIFVLLLELYAISFRNLALKLKVHSNPFFEEKLNPVIKKNDERMKEICMDLGGQKAALIYNELLKTLSGRMQSSPNDYLGSFYMSRNFGNEHSGQFFTPYFVSKLSAQATLLLEDIKALFLTKNVITICDPTCGAGGLLIASADIMFYTHNISVNKVCFFGSDIDIRCFYMTYIQLCCLNCMGIIQLGNSLKQEFSKNWETPAYILFQMMHPFSLQSSEMKIAKPISNTNQLTLF